MGVTQLSTLINKLSKYGKVEVCKVGVVFTVLITGENLTKMDNYINIQKLVLDFGKDIYPIVEVLKNEHNFYLSILREKQV